MIKSIVNTVGTKFFTALFNFLILLVTSNFLGTEGRGQISLIISTITLILLFSNFVGGNTLVYLGPRKPLPALMFVSYGWSIISSLLAFLVLYLSNYFSVLMCMHIAFLSLLFSFTSIHLSLLLSKEEIKKANAITLFQVVAHFFLLSLCFIIWGANHIEVFIYSLYITYGIAFLGSAYFLKDYLKASFRIELGATLRMAFAVGALAQVANLFQFLNYRLDIYLLEKYDSLSNLGIYSTSTSIAEAALLFGSSFALVQFSSISNSENQESSRELTIKLTRLSILLGLFAYLPLFIFPDEFYNFLLGKDFHHVRMILLALAPGILFLGSSITLSHYFAGTGKYQVNVLASFIGLCITLILGFIFIPKYGFMAAAWISSISYFFSTVVLLIAFASVSKTGYFEMIPTFSDMKFLQKTFLNVWHKRSN